MKYKTEIVFDVECGDWWVYVNGEVEAFAVTKAEAEQKLIEFVSRMERHAREEAAKIAQAQNPPCAWMDEIESHLEVWEVAA